MLKMMHDWALPDEAWLCRWWPCGKGHVIQEEQYRALIGCLVPFCLNALPLSRMFYPKFMNSLRHRLAAVPGCFALANISCIKRQSLSCTNFPGRWFLHGGHHPKNRCARAHPSFFNKKVGCTCPFPLQHTVSHVLFFI